MQGIILSMLYAILIDLCQSLAALDGVNTLTPIRMWTCTPWVDIQPSFGLIHHTQSLEMC